MTPNDVKIVAENIGDFVEVPDGINRLRKAVLTLAVSGKLVPQNKNEGTAEELYKLVQVDRAKTANADIGRKRKAKESTAVADKEVLFEIPPSWKWVHLGDIVKVQTGKLDANASSPDGKYPFFTCADEPLKINRFAYDCECVLLAGNGNFNVKYYSGKFEAYQRTYIIEAASKGIHVPYVYLLVQMQTDRFKSTSLGSAMPYIRLGYITEALVALPPLAEQKRIVEKVQSVMKQLDELEAKKRECDEVRTRLARSAMQSLGKSESKIAFEQLTELVKTPSDIKELENALLTLAVSGKLVPQSKADGTAENLYNQIQKERTKVENNSTVRKKKTKDLAPIADDEIPFEVPASWKWVRLGDVFLVERGGSPRPIESYITSDPDGLNWIKIGDTEQGGKYISSTKEKITRAGLKKTRMVHKGDLLLTNSMSFGRPYILEIDGCIHDGWLVLQPYFKDTVRDFFYHTLSSSVFFQQFVSLVSGAVVKNLNADKVKSALIPLPPIEEQKRIVKKVEEVMVLINRLKQVVGVK